MKKLIDSKSRLFTGIGLLFAILSISGSCSKSSDTTVAPRTKEVIVQNMAFDPATIYVPANSTITWTNKDLINNTVTSNTGVFDSGSINPNGSYSHTFATSGSFPYHSTLHTNMTATVIVQ